MQIRKDTINKLKHIGWHMQTKQERISGSKWLVVQVVNATLTPIFDNIPRKLPERISELPYDKLITTLFGQGTCDYINDVLNDSVDECCRCLAQCADVMQQARQDAIAYGVEKIELSENAGELEVLNQMREALRSVSPIYAAACDGVSFADLIA